MEYLINYAKPISPPHTHKYYEIIVYTRGRGIFHANGKDIEVTPGKIIIIPPGTEHGAAPVDEDFERIYISGPFQHMFNLQLPTVVVDNAAGEGLELAKILYKNRFSNQEYITALIGAFAHFLLDRINMENEIFLAIKDIVEEVTDCFHDSGTDLSAILRRSGYSEDYIRAQFKKITGKTPTEFLTKMRIAHARYLIDTYRNSIPLSDIAGQCGYTDYVYFSRRFKQVMGLSPRSYLKDVTDFRK